MIVRKASYYDEFRCIGGSCTDSCCKEWAVQIDDKTAAYYRSLAGPLGDRLRSVLCEEDGEWVMRIENGRCPMWREDGLCRIQAELGEAALSHTCREFPRIRHDYGDFIELGLELSCPEAARYILSPHEAALCTKQSGGEEAEYDREVMETLLRSREVLRGLIFDNSYSIGQRFAVALLYGYHVQSVLDGGPEEEFNAAEALAQAMDYASEASTEPVLAFFSELEILSVDWESRLMHPSGGVWHEGHIFLAEYFLDRYWLQAASDCDLVCRVKFMLISCLAVRLLGGDILVTAQRYSKEIENNMDNVEALLDAAYSCPAFTDDKLLGLLLR